MAYGTVRENAPVWPRLYLRAENRWVPLEFDTPQFTPQLHTQRRAAGRQPAGSSADGRCARPTVDLTGGEKHGERKTAGERRQTGGLTPSRSPDFLQRWGSGPP